MTIVISASAGIAAPNTPGTMAVTVKLGTNTAATSAPRDVGQYLNFSPGKAARNATVTVSGGGFTRGTSGDIRIEDPASPADYDETKGTGGTYTVDSSGKLSGSFVASSSTRLGGRIAVRDLGSGEPIWSSPTSVFAQNASATPGSTDVALGAPVSVTLNDFDAGEAVTGTIAGSAMMDLTTSTGAPAMTNSSGGGRFNLTVPQGTGTGTKQVVVTAGKTAKFLITIVSRTLTVSPSSAVPGQAITVSGSGFTTSSSGSFVST